MKKKPIFTSGTVATPSDFCFLPRSVTNSLEELTGSGDSLLLCVFSHQDRALFFSKVKDDRVRRLSVWLVSLIPDTISDILQEVGGYINRTLYTSGLCIAENKCAWEAYFHVSDLKGQLEDIESELVQKISKLSGVEEVWIDPIESR